MSRPLREGDALWCAHSQARVPSVGLPVWSEASYVSAITSPQGWYSWCVTDEHDTPLSWALFTCALDEADLAMMVTVPEARRQGLAKRVLDKAIANLTQKGITTFFLEVAQTNRPAIQLYESCGFVPVGVRKRYYQVENGDRVDAVLMRLTVGMSDA